MKTLPFFLSCLLFSQSVLASWTDTIDWQLGLQAEHTDYRSYSVLPASQPQTLRTTLDVSKAGEWGLFHGQLNWRTPINQDAQNHSDFQEETHFYPINVYGLIPTSDTDEWLVGVQRKTWGAGFGFFPLSPWQDKQLFGVVEQAGEPIVQWTQFDMTGEIAVMCSREADWDNPQWAAKGLCGGRWVHFDDGWDAQAILWGNDDFIRLGAGGKQILGEAYSVWLEGAVQTQTEQTQFKNNQLSPETIEMPVLALIGADWSHISGFSLMAEAWYDGTRISGETWDNTQNQTALSAQHQAQISQQIGRLMASQQVGQHFSQIRLSYSQDPYDLSMIQQTQLDTQSQLWQLQAIYKWQNWVFASGLQHFTGSKDSPYKLQPLANQAYLNTSVKW